MPDIAFPINSRMSIAKKARGPAVFFNDSHAEEDFCLELSLAQRERTPR